MMNYGELVAALAKPGQDIIDSLTPTTADLLHMAVGVSGEVAELMDATDRENVLEEIGDCAYYMEHIYQLTGATRFDMGTHKHIAVVAGELLDAVKKHVIYGKKLEVALVSLSLANLNYLLSIAVEAHGSTWDAVIGANMDKLTVRYGKKYSNEAAIARADKIAE